MVNDMNQPLKLNPKTFSTCHFSLIAAILGQSRDNRQEEEQKHFTSAWLQKCSEWLNLLEEKRELLRKS